MNIGYIGLGKMGKNMVLRLLDEGVSVVVWNRSPDPVKEAIEHGAIGAIDIESLVEHLTPPKIIWLMLPAGLVTENMIETIKPFLKPGDILIDGANSFYKDSVRRYEMLKKDNIAYVDIGVSGGPDGARDGACLMIGGDKEIVDKILPIIKAVSAPYAYAYLGSSGAGHFAKMIHNGIEYGMMESIAEGASVLAKSDYKYSLGEVFRIYNTMSVIQSRLIGWTKEIFTENQTLSDISSKIDHSGEAEWTIQIAKEFGLDIPVIQDSFTIRVNSKEDDNFRNKVVSALRNKFGKHHVKK